MRKHAETAQIRRVSFHFTEFHFAKFQITGAWRHAIGSRPRPIWIYIVLNTVFANDKVSCSNYKYLVLRLFTLCPKKTCDYIFYINFNNKCPITIIFGIVSKQESPADAVKPARRKSMPKLLQFDVFRFNSPNFISPNCQCIDSRQRL